MNVDTSKAFPYNFGRGGTLITYFNLQRPDHERLYADLAKGAPEIEPEILRCPINNQHLDGIGRLSELALQLKHNDRNQLLVWGWIGGCVIHQRILDEFATRGFTGYRLRPATVRFRDGVVSNDYRELIVTGWAGVARPESGIRVVESCPACHWKRYSALGKVEELIDWQQWSGEDFFIVWPLPLFILVTEQVAHTLLEHKASSFKLQGLLEDVPPIVRNTGFTVGPTLKFLTARHSLQVWKTFRS